MATNYDPNMDKENGDQSSTGANSNANGGSAGASSAMPADTAPKSVSVGQSASVDAGQGSQSKPTNSGQFVNLQNYFNANKTDDPNQNMGAKLSGKLNDQGQAASQNINKANTDFNNQANSNRNQYNDGLMKTVTTDPNAFYQQTQTDPSNTNVTEFNREQSGNYGGPTQLNNYDKLSADTQNYQNLTNQTGSEAGRFNLLKTYFNNGSYNQGQQNLDNLLMQGDKNQMQQMGQTRTQAANVASNLQQSALQAQDTGNQYANEAKDTANKVNTSLTGAMGTISDKNAADVQAANDYNTRIQGSLSSGKIAAADASKLGLTAGTTYGVNAGSYFNPGTVNANTVADKNTYQNYDALAHLANTTDTLFTDPTQLGTNAANTNPFNLKNYQSAVDSAKGSYNAAYNPQAKDIIDTLNSKGFANDSVAQQLQVGDLSQLSQVQALKAALDPNSAYMQHVAQLNAAAKAQKLATIDQTLSSMYGGSAPSYNPAGDASMAASRQNLEQQRQDVANNQNDLTGGNEAAIAANNRIQGLLALRQQYGIDSGGIQIT
jgi:hypothetical protein